MMVPPKRFLCTLSLALFATAAPAAAPLPAQTPDPAAVAASLNTATGPEAAALLEKFPLPQLPALLKAVTPGAFNPASHDEVLEAIAALVRRAHDQRDKADEAREERWHKRTGVDIYLAKGKRSPAWDQLVIAALASNDLADAKPFTAAINAGCTDPLIRYYAIRRALTATTLLPADALSQYLALAPDFSASPYSPLRKFQLQMQILRLADSDLQQKPDHRPIAAAAYKAAIDLLPQVKEESDSVILLREAFYYLFAAGALLDQPIQSTFKQLNPSLTALLPDDAYADWLRATYFTDWAWEARGGGYANTVSDDGWKLFGERLAMAEDAATAGANRDPLNPDCPAAMITICMGRGYERPVMEKWFTRAMLASPDNYDACSAKLTYLRPRWGGSSEAQLEFGRQCLKSGSIAGRTPAILIQAHLQVGEDSGNTDDYLAQPAVWADIDAVYKKFLSDEKTERANDYLRVDRARYIQYAYRCQQWAAVIQLSDQFKDDLDMSVFGSPAVYHFYRKDAAQHLAKSPT